MQNKYKCRGIMKWAPFAALTGFGALVEKELQERHKISKPVLSTDQMEEINNSLIHIKNTNCEFLLKYYSEGIVKTIPTKMIKIENDILYIKGNYKVNLYDIINIVVI